MTPFHNPYPTPFEIPPFEVIKPEHFMPAVKEAIDAHNHEIEDILNNPDKPDFENTVARLDYSGDALRKVTLIFHNLNSSNTNPEIQAIAKEMAPVLSAHYDNISLNDNLFKRISIVYNNQAELYLNPEQKRLLSETYKDFVRGGANLNDRDKKRFREINSRLSVLTLQFGENVLKETNDYKLVIDDYNDLAGLPQNLIDQAAETAIKEGMQGKWVFTLHNPSVIPFMQFAQNRNLREGFYYAQISRGNKNNENDNKEIIKEIVTLRLERANLLGYKSHAEYVLAENMASNPANVDKLLKQLWAPAINRAKAEAADLQSLIDREGGNFKLQPWDWRYYTEKLRLEKYNLSDEELKPYLQLENVKKGIFMVANRLYGLVFEELSNVPLYHPDVKAYEVTDASRNNIGVLFMDFHPRESKRGGAWMSSYRKQYIDESGNNIRPIITIVCNFSKPTATTPALLTFDETSTLFHEFGHALHGLLSNSTYYSLTGTSVPRDFVELPSQIMENWAAEPEVLKLYATHYLTGEVIPDSLINKLQNSKVFNQGFETTEYLAASFLDMAYHNMKEANISDVNAFEKEFVDSLGLAPQITIRYKSTYFNHIFSGGYSSGYYSYIWAAILDSDAFEAFKENGLFDQATATSFRKNILERGGTDDPMILYKNFRGADPDIKPLLKKRGLLEI
ncbi:MAG TPA: M3 family metallopeptidase [Lentimicrobium sp.]|nr:M3 family metallopeptidase [Lentimicrobium sp.]